MTLILFTNVMAYLLKNNSSIQLVLELIPEKIDWKWYKLNQFPGYFGNSVCYNYYKKCMSSSKNAYHIFIT